MEVILLFGVMFAAMLIGVPLGFAVALATVVAFIVFTDTPLMLIAQSAITGLDSFSFLAIPLFIMSGSIMGQGSISRRLIDTCQTAIGHKRGGLGLVVVATSAFFGAISGSATATVSAIGSIMMPEMKKKGYPAEYNAMCVAMAGSTSLLIPPSVCLVIYGVATETPIGELLIAGFIPGLVVTACLLFGAYYYARKYKFEVSEKQPLSAFWKALWNAKWALLCPLIILGGIYTGIFTATESAAVAVVYAIFVGLFIYRDLTWKIMMDALKETMLISGMVCFMLGTATAFAKFLSLQQIPQKLVDTLLGITDNPILLMLFCNIILLILGCVVDNIPLIMIMSPLMLPIAEFCGMSPITFGCVIVLNTTIGLITPPYGANLFLASSLAGVKMESTLKYFWAFFIGLVVSLMLITYIPAFTLVLL